MSCEDGPLPTFYRTIRLPAPLWKAVKGRSQRQGRAIRRVIADALDGQLSQLIQRLRRLGLQGEVTPDKLVRMPLDDNAVGRINYGRRQTGLPAVLLLRLCLQRHLAGNRR
jgi:hypothetical protein